MNEVVVEDSERVLVIRINRPEARNAVNRAVAKGIAEALTLLDRRSDLLVGIVTGTADIFCAGMDLKGFLVGDDGCDPHRGFGGICKEPPTKPVIAAVEGWALAGGFEIALACDLIVAGAGARFGLPEVRHGLAAGAGGLLRLPRRVPVSLAMEMALTGDPITAGDALAHGLVSHVTADGEALQGAHELAARIARNGPLSVAASKRVLNASAEWTIAEGFVRQMVYVQPVFDSRDAIEGAQAFAEKRSPVWEGR